MRTRRRETEVFNLSFLDAVSCGFGAVVLLVLISRHDPGPPPGDEHRAAALLERVLDLEASLDAKAGAVKAAGDALDATRRALDAANAERARSAESLAGEKAGSAKQREDIEGLSAVLSSLRRTAGAAVRSEDPAKARGGEVGGIPVDSDHVLFIIDTSGSMREIWPRVMQEVGNVIRIHPKVTGFQVLNDNGVHLLTAYQGRWIPDTPGRRKSVLGLLKGWNIASNSSPVEGLEVALKRYANPRTRMSVYIFGDDYSGGSYDPVIATLERLNANRVTGGRLARVHGVGFLSNHATSRFATLMREVTQRNDGTFVGLPR